MPTPSPLRDRRARLRIVAAVALLAASLVGGFVAASFRSGWGTTAALAISAVIELAATRVVPYALQLLTRAGGGTATRTALRLLIIVLLASRCLRPSLVITTAAAAVVVTALVVAADGLRVLVSRLRRLPIMTRNLDLGDVALPMRPAPIAVDPASASLAAVIAAIGLTVAVHRDGSVAIAVTGLSVAALLAALPAITLGVHALTLVRANLRTRMTAAANDAIARLAPEIVLYFAATPAEIYQVRMWLEPIARLERPAVIVLRNHKVMAALGDVSLPVVCTPYNGVIASLPLPAKFAALFVTHSGNNLTMIRRAESTTVFIGHGDSDKPDSVNPFARVYDEVWVAGPLGRRRYADAGIGVSDTHIVEVGRPQISLPKGPPPQPLTIVYAPTWEGWGDDLHHSSLVHIGLALVEDLSSRPGIRVRYRPHPLTGRRDPSLHAAHQRIVELVGRVPEHEPISETFAQASGLIGDVSSVINEFLPYDRPYAVADTRDLGAAAFVERFPSTRGGFRLSPDLDGLDEFVAAVSGGTDSTRTLRRELVADALGDPATAQQRFAVAVDRLLA